MPTFIAGECLPKGLIVAVGQDGFLRLAVPGDNPLGRMAETAPKGARIVWDPPGVFSVEPM
jgi:hypothetical protein